MERKKWDIFGNVSDDIVERILNILLTKGRFNLPKLGTFVLVKRNKRKINSFGKGFIETEDHLSIKFIVSRFAKKYLNNTKIIFKNLSD